MGGSQSSPTTFFVVNTAGETLPMPLPAVVYKAVFPGIRDSGGVGRCPNIIKSGKIPLSSGINTTLAHNNNINRLCSSSRRHAAAYFHIHAKAQERHRRARQPRVV